MRPPVILTDSTTFSDLAEIPTDGHELIALHISRGEIEAGYLAHTLDVLHVLVENVDNVRRYRDSLMFFVGGYDQDPRALPEIPEVRAYFQALVREWPHWLWFLARDMGAIAMLFSLICRVRVIRADDGRGFWTEFLDPEEVASLAADLFARGNVLADLYGLSDEEVGSSAESFARDILRAT